MEYFGFLEVSAAIIRIPDVDLVTVTPCCCTDSGSSDSTCESLFCVWTWAVSASVPFSKVSVMLALPADELFDDM